MRRAFASQTALSSVQADRQLLGMFHHGHSERAFSAKTRAPTSQQWIALQLHLVDARVCVCVWWWGSSEWGLCPTRPILAVWLHVPNTPTQMLWPVQYLFVTLAESCSGPNAGGGGHLSPPAELMIHSGMLPNISGIHSPSLLVKTFSVSFFICAVYL